MTVRLTSPKTTCQICRTTILSVKTHRGLRQPPSLPLSTRPLQSNNHYHELIIIFVLNNKTKIKRRSKVYARASPTCTRNNDKNKRNNNSNNKRKRKSIGQHTDDRAAPALAFCAADSVDTSPITASTPIKTWVHRNSVNNFHRYPCTYFIIMFRILLITV